MMRRKQKASDAMTRLLWCGVWLVGLLLLVCVVLRCGVNEGEASQLQPQRRCPRTKAPAQLSRIVRFGDKCYRVFTCSEACGKSLETLLAASEPAFADKYRAEQRREQGVDGLHLCHHISKEPVQFALEVRC